jgi:hypothetical protein
MSKALLSDLGSYFKDIATGMLPAFLLFLDILGAIIFFFPQVTASFVANLALVRLVGGILVFVSFFIANFCMYRRLVKRSALHFDVESVENAHVRAPGFISLIGDEVTVQPCFDIEPTVEAFLVNTGSPTAVRISVVSVEPNCLPDGTSFDQIEIFLRDESGRDKIANPMRLNSDAMCRVRIAARIPFATTKVEETTGAISSLRSIALTLGAQAPGQKPLLQVIQCNLTQLHSKMEEELAKKAQHLQSTRVSGQKFIEAIQRYYKGPGDAD